MRPQLFTAIKSERDHNLQMAKRLRERAETAELFGQWEIAAGLRKAAANFRERALGNPTPETEMQS